MIANMNEKGRQTKLLAAVAILAMVVCVFAVAVPAQSSDAVPTYPAQASDVSSYDDLIGLNDGKYWDAETNTFTVPATGLIINLTGNIGTADAPANVFFVLNGDLKVTSSGNYAMYIDAQAKAPAKNAMTFTAGETFTLENANAYFEISKASGFTDNDQDSKNDAIHVFGINADITVTGNSKMTVTQASNVNGVTVAEGAKLTIDGASAQVTFDKANAVSNTELDMKNGANLYINSPNSTAGNFRGTVDASFITVSGMSESENRLNFYSVTLKNGAKVTSDGTTGFYEGSQVSSDDSSSFKSKEFTTVMTSATDSGPALSGTFDGNWAPAAGTEEPTFAPGSTTGSSSTEMDGWIYKTYDKANGNKFYYTMPESNVSITDGMIVKLNKDLVDEVISVITPSKTIITLSAANDSVALNYDNSGILAVTGKVVGSGTVTGSSVTIVTLMEDVTITGAATLGTMTLTNTITLSNGANLVIPVTSEITFATNGKTGEDDIKQGTIITDSATVWIYGNLFTSSGVVNDQSITAKSISGTVKTTKKASVEPYVEKKVDESDIVPSIVELNNSLPVSNYDELMDAIGSGMSIEIDGTIVVPQGVQLDLTGLEITFVSGSFTGVAGVPSTETDVGIYVSEKASLNIQNSTLDQNGVEVRILSAATSSVSVVDSMVFMVVDIDEKGKVTVNNANVTYDNTTDDVKVGYGTQLDFTGTPKNNVYVYGTLNINGNATISSGKTITVYQGGVLNVTGSLTISGTADFQDGSEINIDGTATVSNSMGGAGITSAGKVTVTGTLTINASAGNVALDNTLDITAGEFTVEGTLNMNGKLSGTIHDKGTVNINGEIDNKATIKLYNGMTITVASISGGNLEITDGDYENTNMLAANISDGNKVSLNGVKGITVAAKTETGSYTDSDDKVVRYTICNLDISGTVTAGTIDIAGSAKEISTSTTATKTGKVTMSTEMALGKDVFMDVTDGEFSVTGMLSAVTADSESNKDTEKIDVETGATLTVTGEITTVKDIQVNGTLNAVMYSVTPTSGTEIVTVYHYTSFDAAVAVIGDTDQDTIYVNGKVTANADADIANAMIIEMGRNSELVISKDVEITLQSGAKINGSLAVITVNGTFTSMNYKEDVRPDVVADVVKTNGNARTWTSLANALAAAASGDVITLAKDVMLTSDTTIPEGVTVESSYELKTGKYTLTVNGTFSADEDGTLTIETTKKGEVIANGVVVLASIGSDNEKKAILDVVDGAHFEIVEGADNMYYVTNVAYAAENVHDGTVTISGSVSAGDVTFTEAEDGTLAIDVITQAGAETYTVFSVGTMTLVGAELEVIGTATMTGTVAAACDDGSVNAEIVLDRANNLAIESDSVDGVDAVQNYVYLNAEYSTGDIAVQSGTVTIGDADAVSGYSILVGTKGTFSVASGATVVVPEGAVFAAGINSDGEPVTTIDGTIEIDEGDFYGFAVINGTFSVSENLSSILLYLDVNGTVSVADEKTLTYSGIITMNDGSSISGQIKLGQTGAILAYPGSDISGAVVEWNTATNESDAAVTEYYVNGELFATAYAGYTTTLTVDDVLPAGDIEMVGYKDANGWYQTQEAANAPADNTKVDSIIGDNEAVYANAAVAEVSGSISQGTGITLYVDGKTVDNFYVNGKFVLTVGTHTLSYDVQSTYNGDNVVMTFNGETVADGATFEITPEMTTFAINSTGAVPAEIVIDTGSSSGDDDGLGLTDILLIILVILIVVMAIMVALRLMRS